LDLRTTSTPFIRYLNNAKDSDVRIVVGSDSASKTFHAHSLILKSHSKYYETHLSEVWSGKSKNAASTIIEIRHPELDVKPFETILRFMYTLELRFPESLLLKVASTAHYLLLGNAVLNKLLDLQTKYLTSANVFSTFKFVQQHHITTTTTSDEAILRCIFVHSVDSAVQDDQEAFSRLDDEDLGSLFKIQGRVTRLSDVDKWKLVTHHLLLEVLTLENYNNVGRRSLKLFMCRHRDDDVISKYDWTTVKERCVKFFLPYICLFKVTEAEYVDWIKPVDFLLPDMLKQQLDMFFL
jgi:hypothetical protein